MSEPTLQHRFWAALGAGAAPQVRELVAAGADVNQPFGNQGGETPLIRAINAGDLELVRLLLELGADVNVAWKGPRGWTPLMFAHNQPALLRELLAAGAAPDARAASDWVRASSGRMVQRPGGQTALHLAAVAGNAEAIQVLAEGGADVEAQAEDGRAPLDYAVRSGAITAAAEALVKAGAQLTPERLAIMHAAACSLDSDLLVLPFESDGEAGSALPVNPQAAQPTPAPAASVGLPADTAPGASEIRCPKCHALLYSRKSKLCGQCGALLPADLVLTDQQAQALADQRAWARELADKFTERAGPKPVPASRPATLSGREGTAAAACSAQELLRRVSCVEEFKHRDRRTFVYYILGYAVLFAALGIPLANVRPPPLGVWLVATVSFGVLCFRAWHLDSPLCPNCQRNIRVCAGAFCHICGQPLQHGNCALCGVSSSPRSWLRPGVRGDGFGWITYCPGCGAHLEAKMHRWRRPRGVLSP